MPALCVQYWWCRISAWKISFVMVPLMRMKMEMMLHCQAATAQFQANFFLTTMLIDSVLAA